MEQGAEIVSFHECSITGYTFLQRLDREQLAAVAEPVPDGPSVRDLIAIAREFRVVVMAGLIESDAAGKFSKCYVTVGPDGFITKYHKLHPFISPYITPGASYNVIDLLGVKVGFLICYDNNLPGERADHDDAGGRGDLHAPRDRLHALADAGPRDGRPRQLWDNRDRDPARLRQEFQGPKGRGWLMRWLPARAGRTASTASSATRSASTTTRSSRAWR